MALLKSSVLLAFFLAQAPPPRTLDVSAAQRGLDELDSICRHDAGQLWGVSLCGPVMLIDPETKVFVGNTRIPAEKSAPAGGTFAGVLPGDSITANTATTWAGIHWAQINLPLPEDAVKRRVLLVHETFHRVQPSLGLELPEQLNAQLDTADGRTLLQLEWRALRKALESEGEVRRAAISDALLFRAARRSEFPGSAPFERALEVHEGLAEYTGVKLGVPVPAEQRAYVVAELDRVAAGESFVRAFAYASGPAYGLLLDASGGSWRPKVRGGADLGDLLRTAYAVPEPKPSADVVASRERAYAGAELRKHEAEREKKTRERQAQARKLFVEGPVIHLALDSPKIGFDPRTVVPLDREGTLYLGGLVVDGWGKLEAPDGVLVSPDWKQATIPAPDAPGATPRSKHWTLELTPGWKLVPGDRKGDYRVARDGT